MVPSQIFPVKLVFGVKTKLAAILTRSTWISCKGKYTKLRIFLSQNDEIVYYKKNWSWLLICDMLPLRIVPVKLVFGVITKMAAVLTRSKYHLTESTRNLVC